MNLNIEIPLWLTKRRLSEPKYNKKTFQNIDSGVNDLGLTLNNNISTTKTIPKKMNLN